MKHFTQNMKAYIVAALALVAIGKTNIGLAQCVTSASFGAGAVIESFEGYTVDANNTASTFGTGYTVPGAVSSYTFASGITLTSPIPNSNQYVLIGDFAQGSATWGLANGSVNSAADVPSGNAYLGLFDPNGGSVTGTFTLPVNAKKVGMLVEGEPGTITLTAYNSANTVIGTCSITATGNAANWGTQFLGFNSPAGDIAKVEVNGLTAIIDQFTFEAGTYSPPGIVWGTSPFQDSLWAFDAANNFAIVHAFGPYITGGPAITGMNSLVFDPCGYKTYGIAKLSGFTTRYLVTVDLSTGECTQVGDLGDKFSSLTFGKDGQLYGTTGNGATVSESLFTIDKLTGTATLATALGNGADGEIICYNPLDDNIYHWSGNGTVVYEYFPSQTPYTPVTNIVTSGPTINGETFGALHWNQDSFLVSDISSHFKFVTTAGVYGSTVSNNPDDIRGLAMPPIFTIADDTICLHETIQVNAAAVADYQVIYVWGDGSSDTVKAGSGLQHTYASSGNYTINVQLHYGDCPAAVYWSHTVRVNALPVVTITGSGNLCPGGSVLLTATAGGTSQWYQDGVLISGATSNTYSATAAGSYNMIKTNLNGCSDSAAVGKTVVNVNNPTVNLGNDTTQCGGSVTLDAGNAGATYVWSNSSNGQTLAASATGSYAVTVTDANTCTGTDNVIVIINPVPDVTQPSNQAVCVNTATSAISFSGTLAGTTYDWTNNNTAIGLAASGTGDIASFTGLNTGNTPVTATITVTPTATNSQIVPELLYYKFDGSGTSVPNLASTPPSGAATASIMGGVTQGGSGICNGTLIGSGTASSTDYLNTGWATSVSGSWSISFKTSNITPSATLFYIFGDASAGSFRCFTNGVAGANNWILRGAFTDVLLSGGATVAPHTCAFVYDAVAGNIKAYLDGVLVNTVAQSPITLSGTGPFKVMGYATNVGSPAGGMMDEFMFLSHALTATEVQVLAAGCNTSTCVGNSESFTITVNPTPVVALGNDVTACGSTTLDAGNAGSTYVWSNSTTAQTLTTSANGNYAVTVTDANTCTGTDDINVTINIPPTVALGNDVTQCGGNVPLDAGNAGATFLWNNGNTLQTLSASATGNYAVTVTDVNTCTGTDNVDITINTPPTVALGNDVTQCGGSVPLDAGNAGGTYLWSNGNTLQTLSASATGNYAVTVTDANTCTGTDNIDVTINTVPTVALGNDIAQCGGTVPLNAGNAGATYLWSNSSTGQTLTASATGNYAVTVTAGNTCTGTDNINVTINTPPTVALGNDVTQCGGSVTLDAGNAGSTYAWSNSSTGQTVTASASGNYAVTVTTANNCTGTDNVDVIINTIPTASLTLPQDSACSGSSAITLGGGSPAGGTFSGTNVSGSSFNPSSVGTYTIAYAYADNNGCKDTAYADITVYVCVGINALSFGSVELYPNPASDFVTLKAMGIEGKIQIEIFDMAGKKVDQVNAVSISSGYTHTINLTTYAAGAYIVSITTESGSIKYNLIVQ